MRLFQYAYNNLLNYLMQQDLTERQTKIAQKLAYTICNERYRIRHSFGSGTYGLIFFATDLKNDDKPVAIKVIDLGHFDESQNKEKIQKYKQYCKEEVISMKVCQGQHIMKCYETFIYKELNVKLLVLEYCKFDSLELLIFQKDYLPEIQAKNILKQVLFGLAEFHKNGRCHRDIKAGNICISGDKIVLGDFGCSRVLLKENQKKHWRSTINKVATNIGTIISKSPQMLKNNKYGLKTDLWSIGILYYNMLYGFPPFYFEDSYLSNEVALKVIESNFDKIFDKHYQMNMKKKFNITKDMPELSERTINFLKKLIVIDPKQRIFWKDLLSQEYLIQKNSSTSTKHYSQICMLPLKQTKWENLLPMLKNLQLMEQKDIEELNNINQEKELQFCSIKKLDEKQKQKLRLRWKQENNQAQNLFKNIKKVQYQLKRIQILMKIYHEIKQLSKPQLQKIQFLLVKICFLQYTIVQNNFIKKNTLLKNLESKPFEEYLNKSFDESMKAAEGQKNGWLSLWNHKQRWQTLIQQNQMDNLRSIIIEQLQKKKSYFEEGLKISEDLNYFLYNYKQVLMFHPYEEYFHLFSWPSWKSLKKMHSKQNL